MPIVFDLKCTNCDYSAMSSNTGVVRLDDGREEILGHPAEDVRAREWTGLTLKDLVRDDRLRYAHELVCGACGKLAPYSREDLGLRTESGGLRVYFNQLTYHPSDADAANAKCKACGKRAVRGMQEMEGLICPVCRHTTQS